MTGEFPIVPIETTDGIMDFPAPPPTRVPPGGWPPAPDGHDFGAVYAALADAWGDDASYTYPPDGKAYRRGADGGWWLVDAPPSDEQVMRPIVEEAMRSIGIDVPFPPIIPTLQSNARWRLAHRSPYEPEDTHGQ